MKPKREAVLDAAIEVLGSRGARGLTHRAVDEAAAVPTGTTSNYFRTRQALLEGIVTRFVELDHADLARLGGLPAIQTIEQAIAIAAGWIEQSIGPDRHRTAARYALFLEAAADPGLHEPLASARRGLVDWVTGLVAPLSAHPERDAPIVMDWAEGVILHQLSMPDPQFDPMPRLERLYRALFAP